MAASDKAQYAIEIAAQMTGGTQSVETLDQLTSALMAGGKDAEYFKDAITRVNQELEQVATSVTAANDALGDGRARYKELEKAADMSAKAAERAALKHGGVIPKDLYDAAEKARMALDAEAASLKKLEQAAASVSGKHTELKTKLANLNTLQKHVNGRLGEAAQKTSKLAGALGDLGGPLGSVGQKVIGPVKGFVELSETFGASRAASIAMAAGIAIAVAAVVALSAAAVAGVVAIAAYGVSLANQARNAKLAGEAFAATSDEAAASVPVWGQVTAETGVTSDRLRDLTKSLKGAKVSAADMPKALKAVATAEAALGQGGADEFIESLKTAKSNVGDVANEVEKKFGGIVARKMLGLEAQGARLQNNLGKTFGGLDIDPLLEGLSLLVGLFDENTASGKALKFLFESIFQPIIDAAAKAMPLIEGLFLGFMIGAMKVYIALQPTIKAIKEFLGFDDETSQDTFRAMWKIGEYVAYAFAALLAVFIAVAAVIGGVVLAAIAAVVVVINIVIMAVQGWILIIQALWSVAVAAWSAISSAFSVAIDAIIGAGRAAWDALTGVFSNIGELGLQIMQGLAKGIMNGAGAVVGAITGAVKGAINAAKSLLGIASPSKLFAEIGGFTAEGMAIGVEDETPSVQAAMTEMVEPPDAVSESPLASLSSPVDRAVAAAESAPSVASAAPSGSASVSLSGVTININGVEGAEDAAAKFRDMLMQMINGTLTQAGGAA
jgi:phage-related protein